MTLKEKLALLDLDEEEQARAEEKFLGTLSCISENEIKEIIEYLRSKGINITKAREIKILGNSKDEIAKKFSILDEIHETDIYRENPTRINKNVIDIYKKIKYCMQNDIQYKWEVGADNEI